MADKRKALEEVFDMFDQDKSGKIDAKELKAALKEYYNCIGETVNDSRLDKEVGEILQVCDTSSDGKIDKKEWFKFFDE